MDTVSIGNENLRPQPAPRKRPLRTYGKQPQRLSDRESEPPRKRRALEDGGDSNNNGNAAPRLQSCAPSSPQLPKISPQVVTPTVKRGSILAFFKPVPAPTPSSVPESHLSSDATFAEAVPSSPPSSPPLLKPVRTKRRLTTRVNLPRALQADEAQKENELPEATTAEDGDVAEPGDNERSTRVDAVHVGTLQELESNMLNHSGPPKVGQADGGFKVKHEGKRRAKKATVQTTLNLSLASEPGFTICKLCDLLYNPLNDKDKKDHARRHAAVMRKKAELTV